MTSAMELPLYGKVKLFETSKSELLDLWNKALSKNDITVTENTKVENIEPGNGYFLVTTNQGQQIKACRVLLAIGRRGTPRKLNIPGEVSGKVAYRLLEPEKISGKNILVVGGGDSAVESAMMLADQNTVTLSYRKDVFQRIKPKNRERIEEAMQQNHLAVRFNTIPVRIEPDNVLLSSTVDGSKDNMKNELVYIFAGGELPTRFLEKIGLEIARKYGEAILKHK